MINFENQEIYFSTYTVSHWIKVFEEYPDLSQKIYQSLKYFTDQHFCEIYAFVIMPDHIHLIWKLNNITINEISQKFKSYTAKEILGELKNYDEDVFDEFISERKDRKHKFWKLNSGRLRIKHWDILIQKINYIHKNPIKGAYKKVDDSSEYYFSSAFSYEIGESEFSFLKLLDLI